MNIRSKRLFKAMNKQIFDRGDGIGEPKVTHWVRTQAWSSMSKVVIESVFEAILEKDQRVEVGHIYMEMPVEVAFDIHKFHERNLEAMRGSLLVH